MFNLLMIQGDAVSGVVTDQMNAVASVASNAPEDISLLTLAVKGGWVMLVLAILLAIAIYVSVERYLTLRKAVNNESDKDFMNKIRQYIHEDNIPEARNISRTTVSPIARMIDKGLSRLGRPLPDIQAAIENEGKLEVANLEKRVSLVATVASLGPMLGFLGTVTGMIKAFRDMSTAGNNIDIQLLSSGIYEAMVTTVGGLIVGIIAYSLYNLLVAQINKVVFTLEANATEFMDLLHEPASRS